MKAKSSRDQLLALLDRMIVRQDAEHLRIARMLHDDVLGAMVAAKMNLHFSSSGPSAGTAEKRGECLGILDAGIQAARSLEQGLRPHFSDLGLRAALQWQARHFEARTATECTASLEADYELSPPACAEVIGIVRVALGNVLTHSGASKVSISVWRDRDSLTVQVRDNGRGLAPKGVRLDGLGVLEMKLRAQRLKGTVALGSSGKGGARGTGTVVRLKLPLHPELVAGTGGAP